MLRINDLARGVSTIGLFFAGSTLAADDSNKVIYGTDTRVEVRDYTEDRFIEKAKSVAAMISANRLIPEVSDDFETFYTFEARSLLETINACADEPFLEQPALANCTGFLVGEDILVTAGHCVPTFGDCRANRWVFGFEEGVSEFSEDQVYSCRGIIGRQNDLGLFNHKDYAVIKLDRPVEGRRPLKFREFSPRRVLGIFPPAERLRLGTELVMIGHPTGLPMKIADDAQVRRNRRHYFYSNLDAYGGNSGSPVFNRRTGEVEGILVRSYAGTDFVSATSCFYSRYVPYDRPREIVHRITRVPEIQR